MDWQQAQKELLSQLSALYDGREAAAITDWVMEHLTGWKKIDRILHRSEQLPPSAVEQLKKYTCELLTHRPVQYVLRESWFCGMKFYVDERVLIPRPETEELVEWIQISPPSGALLDVGTGSGCIAIALKKKLKSTEVYACDLSDDALTVARQNAVTLDAPIHFEKLDFRDPAQWDRLPEIHCLVSNPPYIPLGEKSTMAPHVVGFEPHMALFVEDADPLIFYKALARFAVRKLAPGGSIFAEIHEALGDPVAALFRSNGLQQVIIKKDLQGKDRMIKATR
jgi:release factor glutamine methyltransferase